MPTWKTLQQKNPEWDGSYWHRCRALYAGGKTLLGDAKLMQEIFPRHLSERPTVYAERLKRAYFIPYPGEIIGMIVSALFSERIVIDGDPAPDPWYQEWAADVSPPGGQRQSLDQFLKDQVISALCCKRSWTLIDLPMMNDAPPTLLDQERAGALDAYACAIDPECVWDWEYDSDGKLLWVIVHRQSSRRVDIDADRTQITDEWTYYTPTEWRRYAVSYDRTRPPQDADDVPLVAKGRHTFGEVPVIPLDLPDGLWAMGKIECIAVAHLNKRNALSWAMYKSLFPVMVHYAGAPDATNPATEDPNRMMNQTVGQGAVVVIGDKDRLEWVGPPSAAYDSAAADLSNLRDEMHRVLHQMALSVDNSAAALGRSADSKQVDQSSAAVVLREFGKLVREHVKRMLEMVQRGRADAGVTEWSASGMDSYDAMTVEGLVAQAQTLETISIPSETFQRELKFQIAKRVLGDNANDETMAKVRAELDNNISGEQFAAPAIMAAAATAAEPKAEAEGEPEPEPGE